jgi:4'-phosphopantetheinyl transferase
VDLDCGGGDIGLLSTRERACAGRLKRPDERRRSLEAHCAVRRILALQLGVDPAYLEFDATDAGKPFLAKPAQALQFNLSHSGRHSLIAVAEDRSVGVDIEMSRPMSDLLGVAMGVATTREIDLLRQLPAGEMHSSFFDLWTRKEALLKAIGRGFLVDPRQVTAAVAIEGELTTALVVRPFQ